MPSRTTRCLPRLSRLVCLWMLVLAIASGPALAADPTQVVVAGGVLGMSPEPTVHDFVVVALNGTARSTTSAMDSFVVTDARGDGAGWTVSVQASSFREWDGTAYVPGGATLPPGSLEMPAPSISAQGTDSAPPVAAAGPHAIDGTSVVLATAGAGTGMGSYAFDPGTLVLSVPASAYATTYRSEVSISLTSGP